VRLGGDFVFWGILMHKYGWCFFTGMFLIEGAFFLVLGMSRKSSILFTLIGPESSAALAEFLTRYAELNQLMVIANLKINSTYAHTGASPPDGRPHGSRSS